MSSREEWKPALDAQIKHWSALSCDELISQPADIQTHDVDFDSKKYQVEVQLLENTQEYAQVCVAVDDGSFWGACHPLSTCFISEKQAEKE